MATFPEGIVAYQLSIEALAGVFYGVPPAEWKRVGRNTSALHRLPSKVVWLEATSDAILSLGARIAHLK